MHLFPGSSYSLSGWTKKNESRREELQPRPRESPEWQLRETWAPVGAGGAGLAWGRAMGSRSHVERMWKPKIVSLTVERVY